MFERHANKYLVARHKLIRGYLKAIGDKRYKSKADYWPWVKVVPAGDGRYDIAYRDKQVCQSFPFYDFKDTGGSIAIIGGGPSVKMMDMQKIVQGDCVLLNGSISLVGSYGIKPLASVIIDSTFVENRFDLLACLPEGSNLILTPGVIRAIAERDAAFLHGMNVYLTQNIQSPAYDSGSDFDLHRDKALRSNFSFDLNSGFVDGGTVMAVAMQFAYQIGAKETYLVGLDIGNAAEPRFYETNRSKLKCGLASAYESSILPFMKTASDLFARSDYALFNCSPITKLPYDVIAYSDRFQPQVDP